MFVPREYWERRHRSEETQLPLTLELPLPEPPLHRREEDRESTESERGIWITEI